MRPFKIRFLLFSIALFVLNSCKSFQLSNVSKNATDKQFIENQYFTSNSDYVYKSQIDIYGNQLSGILILKEIGKNRHRVALTSDFGNKLLDFEISDSDFKVNYMIPDLDKKIVKSFLEKDFRLLLKTQYAVNESFGDKNATIYVSSQEENKFYLFYEKSNNVLNKIIFTNKGKEKINFNFTSKNNIFANEIEILHKDFKLNIKLHQITENN